MAVKTFTSGEVLTASDTNTYLANAGLVYITSASFSAATSVNVNNCFTSTYRDYRLIIIVSSSSASVATSFRLSKNGTASSTGYGYGGLSSQWGSATTGSFQSGNAAQIPIANVDSGSTSTLADITLYNPQTTSQANFRIESLGNQVSFWQLGRHGVNDNMDGFQYFPASGNVTGSYVVYGIRNA